MASKTTKNTKKSNSEAGSRRVSGTITGQGSSKRRQNTSNTKRKKQTAKETSKKQARTDLMFQEIVICLVLAVSILMLISNFGVGGPFGNAFADLMFGLFGLMQYIFPFVLLLAALFYLANREKAEMKRKMTGGLLLFVFLAAFMQLLTQGYVRGQSLWVIYRTCAIEHTGGGVIGGLIVTVFAFAFGTIGAYILTFAGLIISTVVLTQKPIVKSLTQKAFRALRLTWEKYQIHQEFRELERAAIAQERQQELEDLRNSYPEELSAREAMERARSEEPKKKTSVMDVLLNKVRKEDEILADEQIVFAPEVEEEPKEEASPAAFDPSTLHIDGDGVIEEDFIPSFLKNAASAKAEKSEDKKEAAHQNENDESAKEMPAKKLPRSTPLEKMEAINHIELEIRDKDQKKSAYRFPSIDLLTKGSAERLDSKQHLIDTAEKLQKVLADFGVNVRVVNVSHGPTVTRYELQPEQGVKVSRIVNLQDDIKLNLAASEIRIEAPIPGKAAVGIEVPNKESSIVLLRDLLETPEFQKSRATIPFAVGKDIAGKPIITDIEKMPHLLIAGATGSGKSVCINTLIMSILYKASPDDVKMVMIDPKVVEMKIYDGIPHLLIPVVTDAKKAANALNWAVQEMTDRYNKFASHPGIRDIKGYNHFVREHNKHVTNEEEKLAKMPRIVIIVDELADLMMVASGEVEDAICRLAQLARAAGIHLIIATQRPSVNVVTGLIKANMPSRIALSVTSGVDSRTIIDMNGAEKLLGHGDMLFYPQNYPKPARVQGDFVSDEDITRVVEFLTSQGHEVMYNKDVEEKISNSDFHTQTEKTAVEDERDVYFADAGRLLIAKDKASSGYLQRSLKIGFNRAARIMDQLTEAGVLGPDEGKKPRKVLMTMEEFEQLL